jgi:hypothetical protein
VLSGEEGCGKTFCLELVKELVGKNRTLITDKSARDVTGPFNGACEGKVLVALNDSEKTPIQKMKSNITDRTITVANKGENTREVTIFFRIVFTTNDHNLLVTNEDCRRTFLAECSNKMKKNKEFWTLMWGILDKPDSIATIFAEFEKMAIPDGFAAMQAPKTNAKPEKKEDPLDLFAERFAIEKRGEQEVVMYGADIADKFHAFLDKNHYSKNCNKGSGTLVRELKRKFGDGIEEMPRSAKGQRSRYNIPKMLLHYGYDEKKLAEIDQEDLAAAST